MTFSSGDPNQTVMRQPSLRARFRRLIIFTNISAPVLMEEVNTWFRASGEVEIIETFFELDAGTYVLTMIYTV